MRNLGHIGRRHLRWSGLHIVTQLIGIAAYAAICIVSSLILFLVLKSTVGIRVSKEEEILGLDIGEHGMEAYSGFQIFTTH